MEDDTLHNDVLNSDKPDCKLEFFWLTFKDSIKGYLTESELIELAEVSCRLNDLQREERYEEIQEYIKSHIEHIGYGMMATKNTYKLSHLETNLKRWNKLTGNDIYPSNNTFYCILLVYLNLHKANKNKQEDVDKMFKCIADYSRNTSDPSHLIELMNLSIENKLYGNIDKLRNILDINAFIDPASKGAINESHIKTTRAQKLAKHLKPMR
jgi:hypothetical protein